MLQGRFGEAITLLNSALELSADAYDPLTMIHAKISAWGFLAGAHLRMTDLPRAQQAADIANNLIAETKAGPIQIHVPRIYLIEVYLALWAALPQESAAERKRFAETAGKMCRELRMARYAGKVRALRCQGLYDWQAGRPAKAQRAWGQSLELADRLRMPFEHAQAHYEIGRHLSVDDPARQVHLTRARDIFARIGAEYDRALSESALANPAAGDAALLVS